MKTFMMKQLSELPENERSKVLSVIGTALVSGYDEKGNFAFTTEDLSKTKLFKRVASTDLLVAFEFTSENYPAFNAFVVQATDGEFKEYIRTYLAGWVVRKCQFEDVEVDSDHCVV